VSKIEKVVSASSFVTIGVCALLLLNSSVAEARRGVHIPDYCKPYTGSPTRACMFEYDATLYLAPGYACDSDPGDCITCKAAAFEMCSPHEQEGWTED
jgi:hypothetical protein